MQSQVTCLRVLGMPCTPAPRGPGHAGLGLAGSRAGLRLFLSVWRLKGLSWMHGPVPPDLAPDLAFPHHPELDVCIA